MSKRKYKAFRIDKKVLDRAVKLANQHGYSLSIIIEDWLNSWNIKMEDNTKG